MRKTCFAALLFVSLSLFAQTPQSVQGQCPATANPDGSLSMTCTLPGSYTLPAAAQVTATVNASYLPPAITVSVSPTSITMTAGQQQQFVAQVTNSTKGVMWSYSGSGATVDQNGLVVATAVGQGSVVATSLQDGTKSANAQVIVTPIPTAGGDNAYCGMNGTAPNDGPAQLPQLWLCTQRAKTPSPGKVTTLVPGSSLQSAYNAASCGDTIVLQAGAVYVAPTSLGKACDAAHWITIRTSTPDTQLPPETARITPGWAGVASLPGRPSYALPAGGAQKLLATVQVTKPIDYTGASGLRWIGIEFAAGKIFAINALAGSSNIYFDQVWMHGDPSQEATVGVGATGADHIAVVHSYFSDFSCTAITGTCTDSHAFSAVSGKGVYKVVDNFLEAAGEAILFGGGSNANGTPGDIEIRENHFFKPLTWMPGSPNFDGRTRIVKNHFECKNAQRLLFEGNKLDNNWGGFSQNGFAILLTPKNQAANGIGICPTCFVKNITLRFSTIHNTGPIMQVSNGPSDAGTYALEGNTYSIHDLIADGLNFPGCYKCGTYRMQIGTGGGAPATDIQHDVTFNHITAIGAGTGLYTTGGPMPAAQKNYQFTNSIFDAGTFGIWSTGSLTNCATAPKGPKAKLDGCYVNYTFAGNVLPGGDSIQVLGTGWPAGNFTSPVDDSQVGYVNLAGGDYHLAPTSPYKGKATDGKDPGADVDAVSAAVQGVD